MQTALLTLFVSLGSLLTFTLFANRVEIPAHGGEYTEALVGEPQLINPLYATTNDVDKDLVALIFSGLMRWDPEKGLTEDLAESININEEGTVLTFTIREDARFHNGDPVLARDILFTVNAIQNPAYRSPLLPFFRGVSVVQEDDRKISFVLEKAQPSFLQNLTVGILSANAWADILPQNAPLAALNLQPIGSGPYQFDEFTKDKKGSIRSYTLKPFGDYIRGEPKIERLTFKFYADTPSALESLSNKFIEGISVIPFENRQETRQNRSVVVYSPLLTREVVLYFNQKTSESLKQKALREAIAHAINKDFLVQNVLKGEAQKIIGPLLPGSIGYHDGLTDRTFDVEKAKSLLPTSAPEAPQNEETGKKPNQFTLTTINSEEFIQVAEAIKIQLAVIGVEIEIVPIPAQTFFEEIVKPRNFELLLTTVMYHTDPDPYVFWHSSQKEGTGFNIVEYANGEVDQLLEQARTAKNEEDRKTAYKTFQEKLMADVPAVFLYQSTYGYGASKKIQNVKLTQLRGPSDRFANIHEWYIKTKKAFK